MYKDAIETQDAYAILQYNACCRYLDIPASFDVEGKTLLEKIVQLTEQRDEARLQAQYYRDTCYKDCEPYLFSWEQLTNLNEI